MPFRSFALSNLNILQPKKINSVGCNINYDYQGNFTVSKIIFDFHFISRDDSSLRANRQTAGDFLVEAEKETNDSLKANWIRKAHIFYINSFKFGKADSIFESHQPFLKTVPGEYAVLLRQTGWGHYLQGQHDIGDKFIKEAFSIRKDSSFLMTTQLGNANFSYLKGDYFRSLEELQDAFNYFSKQDTSSVEVAAKLAAIQNMIGFNTHDLGYFRKSIAHFQKAKSYAKQSQRTDIEVVAVKFISKLHLSLGQFDKSLANLEPYRTVESVQPHLWQTLAMIYHQVGAEQQCDSLMQKWGEAVDGNELLEVNYCDIRAELFLQNNKPNAALPFIKKYSKIAGETELIKLEADQYFCRYHIQTNQLDSAEYYAGNILVRASGFQTERLKATALFLLGKIEGKRENLFKAQHHFENALKIYVDLDQPKNILQCQESLANLLEKRGDLIPSLEYRKLFSKGKDTLELNRASRDVLVGVMNNLGKDVEVSEEDYFEQTKKLKAAVSKNWLFGGLGFMTFLGLIFVYKKLNHTRDRVQEKDSRLEVLKARISNFEQRQNKLKEMQAVSEQELQIHIKRYIELNQEIEKISIQMERQIFTRNTPSIHELKGLKNQLESLVPEKDTWDDLMLQFNRIYPNFTEKLIELGLKTPTMMRHSICLIMNLSLRDSSKLLDISESGVKKARNRIRKELGIPTDQNLSVFLQGL